MLANLNLVFSKSDALDGADDGAVPLIKAVEAAIAAKYIRRIVPRIGETDFAGANIGNSDKESDKHAGRVVGA